MQVGRALQAALASPMDMQVAMSACSVCITLQIIQLYVDTCMPYNVDVLYTSIIMNPINPMESVRDAGFCFEPRRASCCQWPRRCS